MMDWPINFPAEVVAKMRELHRAGVPVDYYGAKLYGSTGYHAADALLPDGWTPEFYA